MSALIHRSRVSRFTRSRRGLTSHHFLFLSTRYDPETSDEWILDRERS